ncbi:MAG: hypothetical protein LBR00_02175, partial [Clostridiales Family XIII bacterium]|nr:hypothetical protein [Clostridiales Family XIII bacterium]
MRYVTLPPSLSLSSPAFGRSFERAISYEIYIGRKTIQVKKFTRLAACRRCAAGSGYDPQGTSPDSQEEGRAKQKPPALGW